MRYLLFCCLLGPGILLAQSTAESEVVRTLATLFDGMQAADSAAVASVFHPQARLLSVDTRSGEPKLGATAIARFVAQIGSAQAGQLEERLLRTEVRVDGDLATAWTEYSFIYNDRLSHCGTNAFQLVRTLEDGWQIIHIVDTRQREGCREEAPDDNVALDSLIDQWHQAAATADADGFYGRMTADGIYIGTDASERWLRDELRDWAKAAFERDVAWAFTPSDRTLYFDADHRTAWWEETLATWMGVCRGSGVAQRQADGSWLISHYHLSVTVPNEKIEGFLELIEKD